MTGGGDGIIGYGRGGRQEVARRHLSSAGGTRRCLEGRHRFCRPCGAAPPATCRRAPRVGRQLFRPASRQSVSGLAGTVRVRPAGAIDRRTAAAAGRIGPRCARRPDGGADSGRRRRVERAGRLIRLPLREFDLLANLARVPDRPVSRDALLRAVWRIDFDPGTNRVEVHMSRLRAKVDRGFDWPMLHTVKGRGYALRSRPE